MIYTIIVLKPPWNSQNKAEEVHLEKNLCAIPQKLLPIL